MKQDFSCSTNGNSFFLQNILSNILKNTLDYMEFSFRSICCHVLLVKNTSIAEGIEKNCSLVVVVADLGLLEFSFFNGNNFILCPEI